MGVMEKMRNSTASILWILIFSFGILWVLADVDFFSGITQGPTNLGVVNGEPITLEEYNNRVSFYTDQFSQQTNQPMTPEMRALYENQAWEDLVAARLIQQKMNDIGIAVTDNELIEMITGDNPDPFIRQQFADSDGNIDRIALRAAIDAPENSQAWIMIEQQLRDNRRQQKMTNFISSGLRVSNADIRNEFKRENSFADIRFLRFPYSEITDDEITVTEDDLRTYYRNNPAQFERSETYRFRFVSWDKAPTSADTTNTINDVEALREAFQMAENDSLFLLRNQSNTTYRGAYVSVDEIRDEYRPVIDLEVGEVSDVVMINGDPHMFKKIDQRGDEIRFAVLSYQVVADPISTIDRLAEQAEEFGFYAASDGFEREADMRDLEIREATATKGNPFIPGLGQSQAILDELETLRRNRISEPIELNDQFVVIQLLERTEAGTRPLDEVRGQVENFVKTEKRKEIMYDRVRELLASNGNLEALAERAEKEIQSAEGIRMSGSNIPGAGREIKVIGSIFSLETGQQSGPIQGESAVFIVVADDISLADVDNITSTQRQEIRNRLEQQKFMAFNQVFLDRLKEGANIRDNRRQLIR
ncbi:MAG: SurA N-terminal domain-containing protein [Balneolaceae bacterium]|nr:SurA N-terminal domain-containing protein [Balneolaceae bacterium]